MAKKLRVGILFGGRSGEHEVSLRSAASILDAIDRKKYDVVPIGINKQGKWLNGPDAQNLLGGETVKQLAATAETGLSIHAAAAGTETSKLDVVFPVLHGTFGEDGTIQGLFELADVAYVGSGVLGSAAGMDKDAMKRMFAASKLPMVKHVTLLRSEWAASKRKCTTQIEAALKYPLFVKPANLGSSVGISKVHDRSELPKAMDEAARFDRKIVIEQGVGGKRGKARELEVAVLGNDTPEASVVGEIVPDREFYDYASKYDATSTSEPQIPAKITKAEAKQIREMAIRAFKACDCSGLARVDFLMDPPSATGKPAKIYLNEINTMPGFTSISMYPKLWEATGVSYRELIDRLITLGIERHDERKQTNFSIEATAQK
ncbi:D-alanine--D-alanine ligase family protein [Terriglobus saanensis]|uniref:D-alanine--D-alanine ligase n=1 Tax=Terriglobus saanensis (strain ATCC BAA-1853 / DSM 23119 / SP1PR4) TaxID=401053 RepID=E8V0N4_TERSS|nr:D-alanine--D-alanine ligase family protein [Terriglobus saanensis]ADV81097.1 D-alanine/D-alanine ligase [Terriglobus saanensis SP1PR4]